MRSFTKQLADKDIAGKETPPAGFQLYARNDDDYTRSLPCEKHQPGVLYTMDYYLPELSYLYTLCSRPMKVLSQNLLRILRTI